MTPEATLAFSLAAPHFSSKLPLSFPSVSQALASWLSYGMAQVWGKGGRASYPLSLQGRGQDIVWPKQISVLLRVLPRLDEGALAVSVKMFVISPART
eukprot:CAMPEP_0169296658 /NCGR_PEP_ID=MMETSP1016-20121227/65262_1 /TAXON_ID=342587 /ORGANISM="Karlodinium micrum, Strain CCMP2283" /LENGTH=97 /DNA_ID=CAMNT_0009388073 /DNA_START=765 /DNA_END=1058 /DNA_ORIENTATION=-